MGAARSKGLLSLSAVHQGTLIQILSGCMQSVQLLCEQVTSDKHPITPPCNNDIMSCVNAVTGVSSRRVLLQTTSVLDHGKCGVADMWPSFHMHEF